MKEENSEGFSQQRSMMSLEGDLFICPNCGNMISTSWGDTRTPKCWVCQGDQLYIKKLVDRVNRQADEITELKRQLSIATNQIPPGIDPII